MNQPRGQRTRRIAVGLSPKYRTLAIPVSVAQNIEQFTHALRGNTIIFIPESKYRTVRLNTGHLATLNSSCYASVAQNIEQFTHALPGITIIFIPDIESTGQSG